MNVKNSIVNSSDIGQDQNDSNVIKVLSNINGIPESHTEPNMLYSKKRKYKALLLCCLGFIGIAGMHRFYTGKKLLGLIYLLTLGYLFVGTIMDLMSILLGDFKDADGFFLR